MDSRIMLTKLMKFDISSVSYYENMLRDLISKYVHNVYDSKTIYEIRNNIQIAVRYAKACNVDISKLFPIIINCSEDINLKFYQNGEVHKYNKFENNIVYLYKSYENDNSYF